MELLRLLSFCVLLIPRLAIDAFFLDIPDVNTMAARVPIEEFARDSILRNGDPVTLMQQDALEHLIEARHDFLDLIADKYSWNSYPRNSDERVPLFTAGDLLLTCEQLDWLNDKLNTSQQVDLSCPTSPFAIWPSTTIYYDYDQEVWDNKDLVDLIDAAAAEWTKGTCVTLKRLEDYDQQSDYLLFTRQPGCASYLGKAVPFGPQAIHVGPTCEHVGVISHLIGHALGLVHEHQRADRDAEVTINWSEFIDEFIDVGMMFDNRIGNPVDHPPTVDDYSHVPYDHGSIMHSKDMAFSKSSNATIVSQNGHYASTHGNKVAPTMYDKQKINEMYCADGCAAKPFPRSYQGYWDPSVENCSVAVCPDAFHGDTGCAEMERSGPEYCGGLHFANHVAKVLKSPNYPEEFAVGQHCLWHLNANRNERIHLEFVDAFDLSDDSPCLKNYIEIKTDDDYAKSGFRFCGQTLPPVIVSTTNQMIVIFRSLDPYNQTQTGFTANYKIVDAISPRDVDDPQPTESPYRTEQERCFNLMTNDQCQIYRNEFDCQVPDDMRPCLHLCDACRVENFCHDAMGSLDCERNVVSTEQCDTLRGKLRCTMSCGLCDSMTATISSCPADFLVIFDSSSSVERDFDNQKRALKTVVEGLTINANSHRIAILEYSGDTQPMIEHDFSAFPDQATFLEYLEGMSQISGTTAIGRAVTSANTLMDRTTRRPHTPLIVLSITDGLSDDNVIGPMLKMRQRGNVVSYAISVNRYRDTSTLTQLAGNESSRVYLGNVNGASQFMTAAAFLLGDCDLGVDGSDSSTQLTPVKEPCCSADIFVLFDSSGSVRESFLPQIAFLRALTSHMNISQTDGQRLAILAYSGANTHDQIHEFDAFNSSEEAMDAIDALEHLGTTTLTEISRDILKSRRPALPLLYISIGDGIVYDEIAGPMGTIRAMDNVHTYAVTAGRLMQLSDLTVLAGGVDRVFNGTNQLSELVQLIADEIPCPSLVFDSSLAPRAVPTTEATIATTTSTTSTISTKEAVAVVDDPCTPDPCFEGEQCLAVTPTDCTGDNCPSFTCYNPNSGPTPPPLSIISTLNPRWRGVTIAPVADECKNTAENRFCIFTVIGDQNCEGHQALLCRESCGKCVPEDECRQQKVYCTDNSLCAQRGPLTTWCQKCEYCKVDDEEGEKEEVEVVATTETKRYVRRTVEDFASLFM